MIDFSCTGCGERFSVPDSAAARNVRCKACGKDLIVPGASSAGASIPLPAATASMRMRRLKSDYRHMQEVFAKWGLARIESVIGDPPERYVVELSVSGLEANGDGKPQPRNTHRIELQLISEYPRLAPRCRMLTPVFHPNIDAATICVGDHWSAGERLADLVVRIAEMIGYQQYNIKSPLNAEAAMWADLNPDKLPIDNRNLRCGTGDSHES
jgi:ubiquitin-protein ligase